uniref:hypothetical protein n=1 Tax=Alistipes putredinis TaxID=28117 RepID=UPI003FD8B26B
DDGAGSRQWFRKTVGTCFTVYQVLPDHFPQCRSKNNLIPALLSSLFRGRENLSGFLGGLVK